MMRRVTRPMHPSSNIFISIFRLHFSLGLLALFACSQDPKHEAKDLEFTEVGVPLTGDPIMDIGNTPQAAPSETGSYSQEKNQTREGESIVEGKMILGQTILDAETNQSIQVVSNLPPHDPAGGYELITYSLLSQFPYEIDWETDGLAFEFSSYASRVPREIRNLSGQKVAIEGFMVPTVVDEQNMVKEFLLMPDQLSCCFGQAPEANGWVVVRSEEGVEVAMDRVIRVLGNLTVEERWDEEFFVGLYHLQCDQLIIE